MPEINEFLSKKAEKQVKQYKRDISDIAKEYDKLADAVDKLENEQKKQKSTQEDLDNATVEYNKLLKQLNTTSGKLQVAESNLNKELVKNKLALQEQQKELKDNIKLQKAEADSIARLRNENSKLRKQRDLLSTTTKEGREEIAKLNKQIDANSAKIKNNTDVRGKEIESVGSYKKSITEALKEQEFFGVSLDKLSGLFTTATGLIGAGVAVLSGLTKAYLSSARGARDLERASDRINGIMSRLGNSIADASGEMGLFERFVAGLEVQLLGIGSAVESTVLVALRETQRELEVLEVDQEKQKKAQLDRAEVLRQIRDEERNSFEERKRANDELGKVITERETESVAFQERRLKNLQALLKLDAGNLDLQKQIKEVEFEIADIREEAEGFRSEQLANDLALSREFNQNQIALTQERINGELAAVEKGSEEEFALRRKLAQSIFQLELDAAGKNRQLQEIAKQKLLNDLAEISRAANDAGLQRIETERMTNFEIEKSAEESFEKRAEINRELLLQRQQAEAQALENQLMFDQIRKESGINTALNIASAASNILGQQTAAGKVASIAEATISGYLGAQKAFTETPGPVFIKAAAAAAAASFALKNIRQILTVDTSIPTIQTVEAFATGTDSTPTGQWLAGEAGRELMIDRHGNAMMINEPTLFNNEAGAKIFSNPETERIMRGDNKQLQQRFDDTKIIEAIKGSQQSVNIDKRGIVTISKRGHGLTKRLNDKYRN